MKNHHYDLLQHFGCYSLLIINKIMKGRTPIYFQKRYCLLVHSLFINQRIALTAFSNNSSEREGIEQTCSYNLNQIVYINCIDVIKDGVTSTDNEARLYFSAIGDKALKKNDIASVRFDMSQEKIMKPESSAIFSKELREGKGALNYKFINLKTKTITQEQFQSHRQKRAELELSYSRDEYSSKIDQLMKLHSEKDEMISKLGKRIETLLVENRRKMENQIEPRESSKERAISLHVKVNTINENIKRDNEKLAIKLRELQEKMEEYEQQAVDYSKEKEIYERQVNMLRKQNEKLEKMHESRARLKGRATSFIAGGASYLKNSNTDPYVMNQSNTDWEIQQNPTKITVNESNFRSRSPSFLRQESEISNKNKSGEQPQNKISSKSSMLASNYIPLNNSESNIPLDKEHSSEVSQSNPINLQGEREDQLALERRISMQKDDLKWTSAIFDRNEAIQILKKKLQFKANEVTTLEKEVEKVKILLKKKEAQIKQMKRQSKKNLIFGEVGSNKDLIKIEQEFEKMQAEHDNEKVRLEQQVERLEKDRLKLDKEVKRLSTSLSEKTEREKTTEAKYAQLKKFTQKKEQEFIEYKQKAKQYEIVNIRNKQLEGAMKNMETKCDALDKQYAKINEMYNRVNSRLKEVESDWSRLKRAERDFQLSKNQNITYLKSIESYENRYNQLKKYCIKIEAAYNKFVTRRQKGPNQSMTPDEIRQNKEIQQKFSQLSKKMSDCQLTYYRQQIEDLTLQKSFLSVFYEKKLQEQKEKINENKLLSEEQKKIQIQEKEKEIEKAHINRDEEMKIRIKKLQRSYEEASVRINEGRESGINRPVTQQLRFLQKKIALINEREQERINERKNLKDSIAQLNDEIKKMGASVQIQMQSQALSKNSSKNLLHSMIGRDGRPINSLIEEVKQRGESVHQKMFEDKVRVNTQLMKENSDMKTKLSRMQMDMEKIEKKAQERQRQLDLTFKKSQSEFKLKNDRLSEQIQKLATELDMMKQKFADSQTAVSKISQEATNLSFEIEAKEQQNQKLEEKIIFYEQRMEEYEKSQRMMLDEVSGIKKNAEQNQQELFNLIETRSDNFAKIEKVKEVEIEKLKGIIKELQVKLQSEMFENIRSKDKIQELKANCDRIEKQTQEKLENQKIDLQNKEAAYDQLYLREFHLNKQNQILQENLIDISTQIENKQTEIATLTYQLTTLNKQLEIYRKQSQGFQGLQAKYKDQIKGLQLLLDDKLQQIRSFEDKYKHLQMEIEYSAKDMQRIVLSNIKAQSEAKEYQEKYMAEREEIIHIKQQYAMLELQMHKNEMFFNNQQQENEQLKKKIAELEKEIARLNQLNSNNQQLRSSRKISNEVDKFDCPSPGKRKPMPKRSGTLQVPEVSSIGAGGITPILPVSPNPLVRKMSENPFQPKEELKKTKIIRGSSIEADEIHDKSDDIAIHIESPIIQPIKSNKNTSNIQIQFDDAQDSIRFTNHKNSFKKPTIVSQIREETEENQENSAAFGHNMYFGDSKQEDGLERHYIEQIQELQRQLIHSNEENEKLNVEVIELTKKNDELMQNLQLLQSQPTNLNRSQAGSLGVSRRKPTLELPTYPKDNEKQSSQGKNDRPVQQSIHRSNSGVQLNGSREGSRQFVTTGTIGNNNAAGELQQQYQAAELEIQYLSNELNTVKNELEEHVKNNERLIEQAELCRETIEDLNEKLEEANFQIEQTKHYVQFELLYNREKEEVVSLMLKIEELNSQIFEKQAHISTLINENGDFMQQLNELKTESGNVYDQKAKSDQRVKELTQTIHKLKIQYRKYQESSQLELVRLNEVIDDLKHKLKEKDEEITVLGQEYLQLQAEKNELCSHLEEREKNFSKKEFAQNQIENKCNQLANELSKTDESRQNLYRTIKQLQLQITQKEEKMKTLANDSAIAIKKYEIRLESSKQELQNIQDKLLEKEKTITILKNEIALYNQQCSELKHLNDQLTYQSTKIQKELKDIMVTYTTQLDSYKEIIQAQEKETANLKSVVREKENEYHSLLKNFRCAEKERDGFQDEFLEIKNTLEKVKSSKMKESNQLFVQVQYKNNEIERLKNTVEQINSQLQSKAESTKKESQKYENMLQVYKQKLERYESLMEQFQEDLKKVEGRPTSEAHEEVIFENQLLRNRIDELQEQLYNKSDKKQKEEVIYMQFRKYKANKERQIQDLQSEMEKYSIKINQLQESTYFLKRQNESLRRENNSLSEMKENFQVQCQDLRESLQEMEKELQFYKKRKMLDMQKLLNDTQ